MYRIARDTIIDHHRRSVVRPEPVDPDEVAMLASAETDAGPAAVASLAACLAPLLARVPETTGRPSRSAPCAHSGSPTTSR